TTGGSGDGGDNGGGDGGGGGDNGGGDNGGDNGNTQIPTEPTIDEPTIEPATTTIIPTEPATQPTVPVLISAGDFEYYEDMPDFGIPLSNGWFAVDLGDGLYEIFGENGVPLGFVWFDGDITDWEDFDDLIPFANFLWPDEAVAEPEPKPVPKTGDGLDVIFSMLVLMALGAFSGISLLRRKARLLL
ncbi:MAG: hypothetical protein FWD23_17550, partial [Oscillospiraceae bacterium]|nr:hypothetical protein [Oscillospiraceae bacterium]